MEIGAGHTDYGLAVKETGNPLTILSGAVDELSRDAVLLEKDVTITKTAKRRRLVRLQGNYKQDEREIIQQVSHDQAVQADNERHWAWLH